MYTTAPVTSVAQQDFSNDDCIWAMQWINNSLAVFMERGYVEKIVAQEKETVMYVGAPWHRLDPAQQEAFLKNFARARDITGHDPSCSVVDGATGTGIARITRYGIELTLTDGTTKTIPFARYDQGSRE
ncbi:MAG: hypothetical protein N3B18_01045 [Desulfobacterota bacterium]|nr:hypothetical protein [Thermodesulfobacteriota bacterium]